MTDRLDRLSNALYGRQPKAGEIIGGSDSRILGDAADRISELEAKLAVHEQDLADAAGELKVPLPEPGSMVAKLLHANVMLRKNYPR